MAVRTFSDWFEVEHKGDDIELLVSFSVTPFIPATHLQPAEGGEVELLIAETVYKIDLIDHLSDAAREEIINEIQSNPERYADDGPDPDDERDRRIDDRLTMGER